MKSIVYRSTGDASVLDLVDKPLREPGPGEVRVKVAVSGVNPTDWKFRAGATGKLAFEEITPNQDGAGTIDAVGPGVTGLAAGDRVWLYLSQHQSPDGTAQEYTVIRAERVVKLPDGVSFDVSASRGVPAITAHRALTVADGAPQRLGPGALDGVTVLVAGGAGAVGHAAIQLARWSGATVITTVSGKEKAELATAAGPHHTINYTHPRAPHAHPAGAPDGVDIVVEVAPGPNLELDLAVLRQGGTIAIYANNGGPQITLEVRPSMSLNVRYQFLMLYFVDPQVLVRATEDVTAALRDGALPVGDEHGLPLHRFPLAETAAAHDAVQNDTIGKVLIDVG